jgi:hypothetical protein
VLRDVRFEGGTIVSVLEPSTESESGGDADIVVVDGTNKLLLPGYAPKHRHHAYLLTKLWELRFLNGHTHSGEMYNRGSIPPLPLELWLAYLWDHCPQDPYHYYLSALLTVLPPPLALLPRRHSSPPCAGGTQAVEGLLTGVTCVLDMPSVFGIPGREFECLQAACRVPYYIII